jgi:hypothetical protein
VPQNQQGFSPRGMFFGLSLEFSPFSAACSASDGCFSAIWSFATGPTPLFASASGARVWPALVPIVVADPPEMKLCPIHRPPHRRQVSVAGVVVDGWETSEANHRRLPILFLVRLPAGPAPPTPVLPPNRCSDPGSSSACATFAPRQTQPQHRERLPDAMQGAAPAAWQRSP